MFIQQLDFNPAQIQAVFYQLQSLHGSIYLDSASDNHTDGNFSVFAWQPKYLIEADLQKTDIFNQKGLIETSQRDPLELIEKYLAKANLQQTEIPFSGGALGFLEYEFGGRFENLPTPKSSDIELPKMFIGIYDTAIVFDHQTSTNYFICQHDAAEQVFQQLLSFSEPQLAKFELLSHWQSNMTKHEYREKFAQVQDYLLSGDCYQINLAQRFSADYQGNEWLAYQKLRTHNSAPFSSFIRYRTSAILSVSPERFLQVKDHKIETKPIKGTRPRGTTPESDKQLANELQQAEKDRAENLMIVDLLRNDVSKVAVPGSVEVPSLFAIESFPAVHHLVSTVTAQLQPPYSSLDLLRGAFPGGSITGAPKIRAMEIIHQLEPHPRSVYCGAIGYITANGDMDSNIAIRTLVCDQGRIHCWAGGGLVADSIWQDEYQETLDKVNKILPVLSNLQ